MSIELRALQDLPEVEKGADLAQLIAAAAARDFALRDGDVVVVSHKIVSKAEGAVRILREVVPGDRAVALARAHAKDPRVVQVVLDCSRELLRAERGVLICETHHGFVCANAGVDSSNTADGDEVVVLPEDPDASARRLRTDLQKQTGARVAIVIADSFGRAWRNGQCDVAIGCAGLIPLDDWRGRADGRGLVLRATWIAVADEIAGAADLVRTKNSREPVVVVRGLEHFTTADDGPGASALRRPPEEDLFR